MAFRIFFLAFLLIISRQSQGQDKTINRAFNPGENLVYKINYGIVEVGMTSLKVDSKLWNYEGQTTYYLSSSGKSNNFWDYFFRVRDYYQSYVDTGSLEPVYAIRNISEGPYSNYEKIIFDKKNSLIKAASIHFNAPAQTFDLLSAIYFSRSINLENLPINEPHPLNIFLENEIFNLSFTVTGEEQVKTSLGTFKCLVIRPALIEGRIFNGQYDMTIYITNDKNHIPVLVKTGILVGYVTAELISYYNLRYPLTSLVVPK